MGFKYHKIDSNCVFKGTLPYINVKNIERIVWKWDTFLLGKHFHYASLMVRHHFEFAKFISSMVTGLGGVERTHDV